MKISRDDLAATMRLLAEIAADRTVLAELDIETRRDLLSVVGRVAQPSGVERRRLRKTFRSLDNARVRAHDSALLHEAATRRARVVEGLPLHRGAVPADDERLIGGTQDVELKEPRACYVCKAPYRRVHFFYHAMCETCGDFNYGKRQQRADLTGKVALISGGRIKIGFEIALILLRSGARVIVTSRFPSDAAQRFAREADYEAWHERLRIYELDLRHLPSVEKLAEQLLSTLDRLDIIIHNAAQTVRRPPHYYQHLAAAEADRAALPAAVRATLDDVSNALARTHAPTPLSLVPLTAEDHSLDPRLFPEGVYDPDGQQVDLREHNSWRMKVDEVSTVELVEVHLVNAMAPFILTSRLRRLMATTDARAWKHIVNVSAMEASFSRKKKTDKHPHTNMAKASLNMLTRTSAHDLVTDGIYMNSVDTGWVTDEDPMHHVERKQDVHDFHPPLDAIDGAARVLDPIFSGIESGEHSYGKFWKDYRIIDW